VALRTRKVRRRDARGEEEGRRDVSGRRDEKRGEVGAEKSVGGRGDDGDRGSPEELSCRRWYMSSA
jgi:hypothetical protein